MGEVVHLDAGPSNIALWLSQVGLLTHTFGGREVALEQIGADLQRPGAADGLDGGDATRLDRFAIGTKQQVLHRGAVVGGAFHRLVGRGAGRRRAALRPAAPTAAAECGPARRNRGQSPGSPSARGYLYGRSRLASVWGRQHRHRRVQTWGVPEVDCPPRPAISRADMMAQSRGGLKLFEMATGLTKSRRSGKRALCQDPASRLHVPHFVREGCLIGIVWIIYGYIRPSHSPLISPPTHPGSQVQRRLRQKK